MQQNYDEPVFLISVVAKVLNIHPQTLRQYEREGLIQPSRTDGKMRLYSQKDMDKIKTILCLTRALGVNLAGVVVILRLKEQINEYEILIEELKSQTKTSAQNIEKKRSLVKKSKFDLIFIKK